MSLLSAGDEVAARGELLLGVDNGLLHRTNERRLSNLRVGMDSGPSDRSTLPPQTAQALAPASQLVHLYWKYTRFTC